MIDKALRSLCLLMALTAWSAVSADWQEEVRALMQQVNEITANEAGLSDSDRFHKLIDIGFEYSSLMRPEYANMRGDSRGSDRWSDFSMEARSVSHADQRAMLAAIEGIDRTELAEADWVNYDLYLERLANIVERQQFPADLMPVTQMSGVQQDVAGMMAMSRPRNVEDFENMLSRLDSLPELMDQVMARMEAGLEMGVTPPAITLRDVPGQVRNQLVDDPADSPVLVAFKQFPNSIDELQQEALRKRAHTAYSERIAPAFEKLLVFLEEEYLPGARQSIAAGDLPNGEAWYAWSVGQYTTTDLTPQQIHDIGLSEVARIRAEMDAIIESTGFEGSFVDFLEFLRTDPQFYHTSAEDLLREYRDISKRADPELMKIFGHLPRTPYGVIPVPSYAEKSQTTAYYQGGSIKAGRAGNFYANTYALDTRPRWEMEALTLHEAVPGHHLQIAIQQELEDVPWFRRYGRYTAFTEGWGLYSESLGVEMGFYKDPYSKFGQLTYEMWRAIRLVVDTGMHQLGWSRQQAIDYFKENAGKQEHDIIVEIDRYIVWPGQALAYKIGELKIKELRAYAEEALGEDFNIRAFHDEVLGRGAIPLDLLEGNIEAWVAEQKAG